MLKPYKIVGETKNYITYEFKASFLYVLYTILIALLIGIGLEIAWLSAVALALMVIFFIIVSLPSIPVYRSIRKATRKCKVEVSGNKWSFKKPLRVKMRKSANYNKTRKL